jgi:hypothetical protein
MEKEMPVSGAFLTFLPESPVKEPPPPLKPSPLSFFRERRSIPRERLLATRWPNSHKYLVANNNRLH